jgi:Pyruvate/2-oxoacid:ferredoxin oxidoreductase gamma subunit
MAKLKIPKRVAGYKVPKKVRKSSLLKGLLSSTFGREVAANALVAGATAAAGVLVAERGEVAEATKTGARKGARTIALLSEAVQSGVEAAVDVVTDAARSMLPDEKKGKPRKPGKAAGGAPATTRH